MAIGQKLIITQEVSAVSQGQADIRFQVSILYLSLSTLLSADPRCSTLACLEPLAHLTGLALQQLNSLSQGCRGPRSNTAAHSRWG